MRIYVPVLAYGHQVNCEYMMAMLGLVAAAQRQGIQLLVHPIPFESLIQRGRNAAMAHFLSDPTLTHMLFIDTDIGFAPGDALRLVAEIEKGVEVIGAGYPQKWLSADRARAVFRKDPVPEDPFARCTVGSVHLLPGQEPAPVMEAEYITTGFLCIARSAAEKMAAAYAGRRYKNDIDGYAGAKPDCFYDLFPVEIHPETRRLESEDYGFCRLWRAIGGRVWVAMGVPLRHHGWFAYGGDGLAA